MNEIQLSNIYSNPTAFTLSESGQSVFEARYATKDDKGDIIENFEQAVGRLAKAAASVEKEDQGYWEEKFAYIIGNKLFIPSTPIWANIGKGGRFQQPSACFFLGIDDSLYSMYETLLHTALVFKTGGGAGYNFSLIRPKGDLVNSTKGQASGVVELLHLYDKSASLVEQGGVRRAASMAILAAMHPEIISFINSKRDGTSLENFNLSVGAYDSYMEAVANDAIWDLTFNGKVYQQLPATELWDLQAQAAYEVGCPGMVFLDRLQRDNPVPSRPITGTNPCVTGDTQIRTVEGWADIADLVGTEQHVYCYDEKMGQLTIKKATDIRQTQSNVEVVEVVTHRGSIKCTPNHKIYVKDKGWVAAKDLQPKDKLVGMKVKTANRKGLCISPADGKRGYESEHRFIARHFWDIQGKDVHHKDTNPLRNVLSNLEVLDHGLHSRVTNEGHADWNGERDPQGKFVKKNELKPKQSRVSDFIGSAVGVNWFVKEVRPAGYSDVYNMEVEDVHNFIANGLVVHNCGEQPLAKGESCLLGSTNWANMMSGREINRRRLDETSAVAIRFLDNLIDLAEYPIDFIAEATRATRKTGLGFTGLADSLVMAGLAYDSEEGRRFAASTTEIMQGAAHETSEQLGVEKGCFPEWENSIFKASNTPMRNASNITVAPTGSVTTLAGCEGYGIEPFFGLAYKKETQVAGEFEVFSPLFLEACRDAGVSKEALSEVANRGTCQGVEGIPEAISRIFKGGQDIAPDDHILMQAAVQKYVDAAVSKTVNLPNDATVEDVSHSYKMAYELDLKGITIYRDGSKQGPITLGEKASTERPLELVRGEIAPRPSKPPGTTREVYTGCGTMFLTVNYDPETGEILETIIAPGGDGGCIVYTEATGIMISTALRAGVSIEDIIRKLKRTHPCGSWQHSKGEEDVIRKLIHRHPELAELKKEKPLSRGKSCASAIAHTLEQVKKELDEKYGRTPGEKLDPKDNLMNYAVYNDQLVYLSTVEKHMLTCPSCGAEMTRAEGCLVCQNCGYSKC